MGRHRLAPDEVIRELRGLAATTVCLVALMPYAASAAVDLKSLLADPPTSDWVESDPTPTILSGPFTAESYGAFLQAIDPNGTDPPGTIRRLHSYGFTTGYARSWEQRGSQDDLDERVFQFGDSSGAGYWYAGLKRASETGSDYMSDISGTSSIPDSFGVVLKGDGFREFRVDFKKGNLVVVIHVDADTNDRSDLAVAQAAAIASLAPAAQPVSSVSAAGHFAFGGIVAAFLVLAVAALVTGLVLYFFAHRRRTATAMAAGVHMSPDWSYWWDGSQWQPAATSVPPAAQRSPDGAYWWDGRSWRPVHAPERPPILL